MGVFLGLTLDCKKNRVFIPEAKLEIILKRISSLISRKKASFRDIARVYGAALSTLLATGKQIILLSRLGLALLASVQPWQWNNSTRIEMLHDELRSLRNFLPVIQGAPFVKQEKTIPQRARIFASDASNVGRAVVEIQCSPGLKHLHHNGPCGEVISVHAFSDPERSECSTWKELKALHGQFVEENSEVGDCVAHFTDNQAVVSIMEKGSSKPHLHEMALRIYRKFQDSGRSLQVFWLRRSDPRMQFADDFSRAIDLDDWSVDEPTFGELNGRAGPFEIDLFASDKNHRLPLYFSKMPSNQAVGRDAFLANWAEFSSVFACPAPKDISGVIQKFVRDGAKGGLLIPRWFSLYGWHLLCEDGSHLNRIVKSVKFAWPCLSKGPQVKSHVFSGFTPFPFLSLEVDGSVCHPFRSKINRKFCVHHGCDLC